MTDRLVKAGFQAYLVGGCVRDLLLGLHPKDFDVSTNAEPEQIQALFRNCRLIGRRFRLAHIHFGRHIIEVATFRGPHVKHDKNNSHAHKDGRLLRDNVYGTLEEDAWRRDFTVNALYLDAQKKTVIDYVGGIEDHQNKTLRLMGDPVTRLKEDPVRLLRAVRFRAKLGFELESQTETPMVEMAPLLKDIPSARLYDEILKLLLNTKASAVFEMLRQYGLFEALFPQTALCLKKADSNAPLALIEQAMKNTESRLINNQGVTPYFLLATILWEPVRRLTEQNRHTFNSDTQAIHAAANDVVAHQISRIAIPRRITTPMREVWALQPRFHKQMGVRCLRFLEHPRFRAAYDFMLLRAQHGEIDKKIADWWTHIQTLEPSEQKLMTRPNQFKNKRKPRKKEQSNKTDSD
ncbi:MAG: poly(A) polymerase [Cycloclasticus sp. symbiont of Bathymodiolus heckerae]|nr:MAG: poly(A) polymerase [Cycloclasticus sp. symbiont of Bathymodiolus heckerae]